jgi:predicted nuclease with RNAse H fold
MRRGYVGVDVQVTRGCPYVVLDDGLRPHAAGWLEKPEAIRKVVDGVSRSLGTVAVGIDAPRLPLQKARPYYWDGRKWRERRQSESGHGRHCEVVLAALKVANPQWTPLADTCPEWMKVGFRLFAALSEHADVYEVFPSASYSQLDEDDTAVFSVSLNGFAHGPKDMLDAYVAAFTVHEYLARRGAEVGGGDGLGAIILPRPLPPTAGEVLRWPGKREEPPNERMQRTRPAQATEPRR